MAGNDVTASSFTTLDAGKLLPGCSIPISAASEAAADSTPGHAFAEFQPLPIDGLTAPAKRRLADSMIDVARSLDCLHQSGVCYGRITSTAFHNRGTAAFPEATLWIDPERARQADAVHSGDAEAMYWTAERLQSGDPPQSRDDWYALGIVLAEIALSSAAVQKIWDLSRSDGKFVEQLLKNLKRARAEGRLKSMAVALIRGGAIGEVDDATIKRITTRQGNGSRKPVLALLLLMPIALSIAAVNLYQTAEERNEKQQQIVVLTGQLEELQRRFDDLSTRAASPPSPPVIATAPVAPDVQSRDRARWSDEIAGRSLEQAIDASQSFPLPQWRQTLVNLRSLPGEKQWRGLDPTLRRLVQRAIDVPWEVERYDIAVERITALNEAYAKWLSWVRSSKTVEEIRTQHELMPSGGVKGFLGSWLAEALEVRSFDLQVRVTKVGKGNEFLSHLVEYESPSKSDSVSWQWESVEGTDESIELAVDDYRAGDPFSVALKQDSSIPYWDSTVIRHEFTSPLLVWQLARGLRLEDSESGYAIALTTNKRFGPPVKLDGGVRTQGTAVDRKVVDPMNDLPFGLE